MRTIYSICVSVGEELQGFGGLPLAVLSGFESFPKAITPPAGCTDRKGMAGVAGLGDPATPAIAFGSAAGWDRSAGSAGGYIYWYAARGLNPGDVVRINVK